MADQDEQYEKSWILHHILDRFIGSKEIVETRRKLTLMEEKITTCEGHKRDRVYTGSAAEGFEMAGSDKDVMYIIKDAIVTCPDQHTRIPPHNPDLTVFMMKNANSRPGYVTLKLVKLGQTYDEVFDYCVVPIQYIQVISSEMFAQRFKDALTAFCPMETHGRVATLKMDHTYLGQDIDCMYSLQCKYWPQEANEWLSRPRLYEWPDESLKNQIKENGCYLVPVGDKTSADQFLQWRISFTTAERKLIHSLTHTQFLIYGLLKYVLKQIADRLERIIGEADILSSYIIKTVIFHAVESSPVSLWQEQNTFYCFMLCFKILIAWVKAGHCPNYFISSNNMFHGKVHGENQQKLLRFLIELHDMKWECLSIGTFIKPSIGIQLKSVRKGYWKNVLHPPKQCERERDFIIFTEALSTAPKFDSLPMLIGLLSKSKSDIDEFILYTYTVSALSFTGVDTFEKHVTAKGNKEKYKYLRKCNNMIKLLSTVCTSSGLLMSATFYYQTGNYMKTLEMCGQMISSYTIFVCGCVTFKDMDKYEHLYCGRGYTLLHKCQEVSASFIQFAPSGLEFCPSILKHQLTKVQTKEFLSIPPLPYAVFLTFMCYHALGDTSRRDEALKHLRAVKYDVTQGGRHHWIVNNLLGICYEIVGDKLGALSEYKDSLDVKHFSQYNNPAMESIERLRHSL